MFRSWKNNILSQVEEAALVGTLRTVLPLGLENERIGVEQISGHQGKVDDERSPFVPLCVVLIIK